MDFKPFQDNQYWGISATVDWTTSIGTVTFIPAYREGSLDYQSATPGFLVRQIEDSNQTSFELRLASDDTSPLRYQIGAYYFNESIDDPLAAYNHQSNLSLQELSTETTSEAIFGRITYAFSDAFRVTAGARWTHEEKDFSGSLVAASRICLAGLFACPTAAPFPYDVFTPPAPDFNPAPDGTITTLAPIDATGPNAREAAYNRVTWRVGADWDVTDRNFLYVTYETGFKAGGFFFSHDAGVYKPESIEAYTFGSKNRFMDNRLQANLELFYWKYKDQQISHLGFDSAGTAIFPTENVGAATMKGAELELQFLPWDNTLLSADFQYLDAEYDDFIYSKPNLNGGIDNGTACPNAGPPALVYTIDCTGFTPPYSPKWTINLGIQQTFPLGNGGNVVAVARMHYQGETLTGLEFLEEEIQDSYATLDASLTYGAPDDRYFVTAYVNNAFDETVIGNSFPTPFSFFVTGSLRPPRTYGLRAGYHF
jgi:iron complex outermembrane receptor protein